MPRPQLMTIMPGGSVTIPFSFLPFSIEFRVLPQPNVLLLLTDTKNDSLLRITLNSNGLLVLRLFADLSEVEQLSYPGRLFAFSFLSGNLWYLC